MIQARRRCLQAVWASTLAPAATPGGAAIAATKGGSTAPLRQTVWLGDTAVQLQRQRAQLGGLRYLNLHQNERTSVAAASALLSGEAGPTRLAGPTGPTGPTGQPGQPGELITLLAQGQRLVIFRIGLRPFVFDPNRIFTEPGLDMTLRRYGSSTPAAQAAVRGLRDAVLALLPATDPTPVVALHNNGAGQYGMRSYRPGGSNAADARRIKEQPGHDPDDFFLVTTDDWFEALSAAGFNVVQQGPGVLDDGSLSVWFAQQRRPYLNVEARHGHFAEQRAMLAAVAQIAARR